MSISKQFSAAAAALFFVVMLLPVANSLAQRPPGAFPGAGGPPKPGYVANGFGKISGTVTDEVSKEPIPFATVSLYMPDVEKPVDGTICDDKGNFTIKSIPEGTYKVVISFIGYGAREVEGIKITGKGNEEKLGVIGLAFESQELEEVVVEGQRSLIEERVDRTIYNAEQDETTKGGDATDVLRRVPMLSVDLDGNVSLRGTRNVTVLIDNKPSAITATSLGDALKQIPADQIKSVEVITSPSARYDAEGSGGIINIITKKNLLQGGSLGINSSAGIRGSNLGLNGSYRQGKMGFTLGGFGRVGYNVLGSFENDQRTQGADDTETLIRQQADTRNTMAFGRYTLGWDYDINKYNWVSASLQYGTFNFINRQQNFLTETYTDNSLTDSNLRKVNMENLSGTVDLNLTYVRSFDKPGKEFSLMALYSRNDRTNDFINTLLEEDNPGPFSRFKNENASYNREITFQADYVTPIGDNQIVEVGVKEIMRNVSSDFQFFIAQNDGDPFVPVTDRQLSNVFNYDQNVAAGYLSYTLNLGNYSFKPGARYEYTVINANFQGDEDVDIPSYGVLVPSVNLARKFKSGNMLKAAYNRRIQRPSLEFLNPNLQAANPFNVTQGNEFLEPEFTNNYELSYGTYIKNSSLNFAAFMRNTRGSIQPLRTVLSQDTILTTYENIGKTDQYGLSVFANIMVSNKLSINGGTDVYYAVIDNNVSDPLFNASNQGWVISGRLFGSYNITDTWALQFFGFMRGRQVNLQGYQGGFYMYNLNLNKYFNEKRGSIGIGAENFLAKELVMRSEVNSPNISQTSDVRMQNMNFKINFSYRIGKTTMNPRQRKRRSIQNDDLKDGDSNSQMNNGSQP